MHIKIIVNFNINHLYRCFFINYMHFCIGFKLIYLKFAIRFICQQYFIYLHLNNQ
jgi:hypothetical protein